MKKRILAVVLTAAAMLTMGACGQGASAGNPSNASENGKGSADSDVTVVCLKACGRGNRPDHEGDCRAVQQGKRGEMEDRG